MLRLARVHSAFLHARHARTASVVTSQRPHVALAFAAATPTAQAALSLLTHLGYAPDAHSRLRGVVPAPLPSFSAGLSLSKRRIFPPHDGALESWRITSGGASWQLDLRLVMDEAHISDIAAIAVRYAPAGSHVVMQADAHGAGNAFVGMVMTYDTQAIPLGFVSGDIGCGMSVVPVVRRGNAQAEHVHRAADAGVAHHAESYWLAKMRQSLKRGVGAESGKIASTARHISEAARFFGTDLPMWLDEMRAVCLAVGLSPDASPAPALQIRGLSRDQSATLQFVSGYAQSLGSSGNHFMELSTDADGAYWLVVHSGCRNLGSHIYGVVAAASRIINAEELQSEDAGGGSASACCAGTHGASQRVPKSKRSFVGSEVATGALATFYVRAHEALAEFAKLNRLLCALAVLDSVGYVTVASAPDILTSGHGAGRARSTTATSKASSFGDVVAFFKEEGVVGNIAPGVLGDNPRSAYKDSAAVVATLPLRSACTSGFLRTRVSYKEGISWDSRENKECAAWIARTWEGASEDERLAMDINLCAKALPRFEAWRGWRDAYVRDLDAEFAGAYGGDAESCTQAVV